MFGLTLGGRLRQMSFILSVLKAAASAAGAAGFGAACAAARTADTFFPFLFFFVHIDRGKSYNQRQNDNYN